MATRYLLLRCRRLRIRALVLRVLRYHGSERRRSARAREARALRACYASDTERGGVYCCCVIDECARVTRYARERLRRVMRCYIDMLMPLLERCQREISHTMPLMRCQDIMRDESSMRQPRAARICVRCYAPALDAFSL